ncbi:uncharacterized protein [Dermacentor andersoni]|uniref:uncharacterized protein n=1 Tax=Dermacentor andersoni TaxID=34620 RepID=UPI002155E241|nr:uncharacterized protein LOC126527973 [Dermacentor andersoni]
MRQFLAVTAVLCFTFIVVDANVDVIIDRLKSLVRQLVPNEALAQQFMDRIDSTRECLLMARDINPAIIQRFTEGIIPTATECAARTIGISDRMERSNALRACFQERADRFKASSGMTPDEMTMFDNAGRCIQERVQP